MMLENCCYDRFELLSTALTRKGVLGEIVHCHGAYSHDLRDEILGGNVHRHYRLKHYQNRNCENYPTHELGPIAKLLGVNRGNRMVKLYSAASKAAGLTAFSYSDKNPDLTLRGQQFAQGDIVNTLITCENGEPVSLTLDTTLPKYYSREFTVRGTKGLTNQEANMIFWKASTIRTSFSMWKRRSKSILITRTNTKNICPTIGRISPKRSGNSDTAAWIISCVASLYMRYSRARKCR